MRYPEGDGCDRLRIVSGVILLYIWVIPKVLIRLFIQVHIVWFREKRRNVYGKGVTIMAFNRIGWSRRVTNVPCVSINQVVSRTCNV